MGNATLNRAKSAKQDDFWTQLSDIEAECAHYRDHFRGKTILCNCDDPAVSNFFRYFALNFRSFGLKRLITTCYRNAQGLDGRLNVRPKYQREFIYNEKEQMAVIDSVMHGYPLNVMYWVRRPNGKFEVPDGQQRTLSLCRYAAGVFAYFFQYVHNLKESSPDVWKRFMDYRLVVYVCDGAPSEVLEWFKIINIAGKPLEEQEMRNAAYAGPWLADAKRWFSKSNCPAWGLAKDYVSGEPLRQKLLEKALLWITEGVSKDAICDYMAIHQNDDDAQALWNYFDTVIHWAMRLFPTKRKELQGVPWGLLYNRFKDAPVSNTSAVKMEARLQTLIDDEDIERFTSGAYEYLIDGDERHLSFRAFPAKIRQKVYASQKGVCPEC